MAEKIKIFELNIDVDAAIESQTELKETLEQSKAALKEMKEQGDTTSRSYVELEANTKRLNREYNASQTQLGKLINLQGKNIKTVEQGEAALTIINKEWQKQQQLFGENSKEADELAKKHKILKDRTNELRKGIGDTSSNIGNYSDGFKEAISQTGAFGQAQSVVNNIMNISKPIITNIKSEYKQMAVQYNANAAAARTMSGAQRAVAVSTNIGSSALKLFKVALISTGIGAIVVLLGSLVAWFANTQEGIDFVNKALAALGAAFDVITDRFAKFGGIVFGLITGQKSLSEAVDETKEAFSGMGDELEREIRLAIELEAELQKLERRQIATSVARSEINKQIKEQNKLAEDTSKSFAERQTAIEKAIALEQKQIKIENDLANDQLKNALEMGGTYDENASKIEKVRQAFIDAQGDTESFQETLLNIGVSNTTVEDVKEIGEAIIKNNQSIEASEEKLTTLGNKKNTINQQIESENQRNAKAAQERSKQAIDNAIKENKVRLELYIEQNKGQAKSLESGIEIEETARDKKLAILQDELKNRKKTQTEFELESLEIKNEFLEKQTSLIISFAKAELDQFLQSSRSRIEKGDLLTAEIVEQEKNRLQEIADKQLEFEQKRFEQELISETELNLAKDSINEQFRISRAELDAELKQQKTDADAIDFENEQTIRIQRDQLVFEAKLLELERTYQAEIAAAEKVGADTALIEQKYAAIKENIKQIEVDAKLNAQERLFGGVADLIGKETQLGKLAGIASATINTFQGVSEVWRAKSVLPEPFGTAAKVVSTGVVLGSGLKAVQKIRSTKVPKAQKGMYVDGSGKLQGARHAQGGIQIEAEGGEYIMNRKATALFYPVIDYMNRIGNGGSNATGNFFADGGIVARSLSANVAAGGRTVTTPTIDYERMTTSFVTAIVGMPRPVTDVKDVIGSVSNYNKIVSGANI